MSMACERRTLAPRLITDVPSTPTATNSRLELNETMLVDDISVKSHSAAKRLQ